MTTPFLVLSHRDGMPDVVGTVEFQHAFNLPKADSSSRFWNVTDRVSLETMREFLAAGLTVVVDGRTFIKV